MKRHTYLTTLCAVALALTVACTGKKASTEGSSESTPASAEAEWTNLFDGQTLNGWKRYNAASIGPLWSVEDGVIVCKSTGGGEASGDGGSLITTTQYGNFELELEFKLSENGNSGILYHVVEADSLPHAYDSGPEYQLLDDATAAYGDLKEEQKAASLYDMYAAPATKKLNPVGEWNTARIVYNDGRVELYLNGEMTVSFDEGSEDWNERYNNSKWPEYPGWNKFKKGAIGLQDHGNATWFRNIRIREL